MNKQSLILFLFFSIVIIGGVKFGLKLGWDYIGGTILLLAAFWLLVFNPFKKNK